jgi:hypothetical protein
MEDSPNDDERWLDAALGVIDGPDRLARLDMRDVLTAIAQDYDLTRSERRRLQGGIRDVEPAPELIDLLDLTPDELAERVMAILGACRTYLDGLSDAEDG